MKQCDKQAIQAELDEAQLAESERNAILEGIHPETGEQLDRYELNMFIRSIEPLTNEEASRYFAIIHVMDEPDYRALRAIGDANIDDMIAQHHRELI